MRVFTFKKAFYLALAFSLFAALGLAWKVFRVQEESRAEYATLLGEANPGKAAKMTPYTAQQQRKRVQKDLLFNRNGQRLQMRLISKEATMLLEHQPEGNYLVEKMQDVRCWMQEELSDVEGKATQVVRYLEADSATYSYKNDEVIASNVRVFRYVLPGHRLKIDLTGYKPNLKGYADTVKFSMAGKDIQFKAHKLKASFDGGTL